MGTLYLDVKYVKVDSNTAWIASQVAEGSNYPGQQVGNWYVNRVVDHGEPGVGNDTISGSGLLGAGDPNTAILALTMVSGEWPASSFQMKDAKITAGNIQVH